MLRLAGGPARGWYPKQRQNRPTSSAENLDKLHPQGSLRAWDTTSSTGTGSRKPLTLPPNLTPPKFFNSKSPRDALRRVTSLLIRKGIDFCMTKKRKKKLRGKTTKNAKILKQNAIIRKWFYACVKVKEKHKIFNLLLCLSFPM